MSSKSIEVVTLGESRIADLAEAVYHNEEPGFQIDGVKDYDELSMVFTMLRCSVPPKKRKYVTFNSAYVADPTPTDRGLRPHIDRGYHGFAVHHNISDSAEVILANVTEWQGELIENTRMADDIFSDETLIRNVRTGLTLPGRLTVFSEGNVAGNDGPFTGLLPTLHHFARKSSVTGQNLWARYTSMPTINQMMLRLANVRSKGVEAIAFESFEKQRSFVAERDQTIA